jgi:hypothetical protein
MSNRRRPTIHLLAPGIAAGLAVGLLAAPPAFADFADIGLSNGYDLRVDGATASDFSGSHIAGVGDVNGDGVRDFVTTAPGADNNGRADSGSSYVVLAGSTGRIDLSDPGSQGFRIDGAASGDNSGSSVAGAGDLNGDGIDDLLIGAPGADNNGRQGAGSTYVVFGGASVDVDLGTLGSRGFRIDGATAGDNGGWSVADAGDVNGDGIDDLLIGAPGADNNGRTNSGSAYLVFGGSTTDVDLNVLGDRGYRIDGPGVPAVVGASVAGAGDVNGDGYDEMLVRADSPNPGSTGGSAYVVFGGGDTDDVDLGAVGTRGWRIDGIDIFDGAGVLKLWTAGAGDANADGFDDILIGAPGADHNGRTDSGSAYLVFGGDPDPVDLQSLGTRGYRIDGAKKYDRVGRAVAGAGDVNADGYDDLLIGAWRANTNGVRDTGATYVIFGGCTTAVDLADVGDRGLRITGAAKGDYSGQSVAGAGDVNADGYDDLLIGAPWAGNNDRYQSGSTYLVSGHPTASLTVAARTKAKKIRRTGRTKLVRRITVGTDQSARTTVTVLPKNARKTVTVKKAKRRVVVRTRNTPRSTRIRVRIASGGSDYFTTTWVRTWRVR